MFLASIFSLFFLCLWETAQYRLKYCLKRTSNPKTTNQPTNLRFISRHSQINKSVVYFIVRRNLRFGCSECLSVYLLRREIGPEVFSISSKPVNRGVNFDYQAVPRVNLQRRESRALCTCPCLGLHEIIF